MVIIKSINVPYTKVFVAKHSSKKMLIETSFLLSWTKLMGPGLGRGFRVWSSAFPLTNVARAFSGSL